MVVFRSYCRELERLTSRVLLYQQPHARPSNILPIAVFAYVSTSVQEWTRPTMVKLTGKLLT